MNVGFYFHIPMVVEPDRVRVPAHLGTFVRGLAEVAGKVTFYAHSAPESGAEDFVLEEPLVRAVDLGPKRSFPARTLFPGPALENFHPSADGVDVMLVRGPSPLLPYFAKASGGVPIAYYLQADYATAPAPRWMPAWRRAATRVWKVSYNIQQRRALAGAFVLVNSRALGRSLKGRPREIHEVISSVITSVADRPVDDRTAMSRRLRLVYAGRIAEEKGLLELVSALARVVDGGIDAELELVGSAEHAAFEETLVKRINSEHMSERVRFRGYVPLLDLRAIFRDADLFVLASYIEGFPHVLLDAMAAGLPVVATRVGGIPDQLIDGEHAVLVEPHSVDSLTDGLKRIARDPRLRSHIATSGWRWAKDHTLSKTCADISDLLLHLAAAAPSLREP